MTDKTDAVSAYVAEVAKLARMGMTTEHSFRPALQRLLQDSLHLTVINEQTHIDCGAPDLTIVNKDKLPIAYVEAKDLNDADLDGRKKNKEQFDRYKKALQTVAFTDYMDFHLYEDGELVATSEDKDLKIRYTDDGSEPTVKSKKYRNPIKTETPENYRLT